MPVEDTTNDDAIDNETDVVVDDAIDQTDVASVDDQAVDAVDDNAIDEVGVGANATDDSAADDWQAPYRELGFENLESPEQAQQRVMESLRQERMRAQEAVQQARYFQTAYTNHVGQASPAQPDTPTAPEQPSSLFAQMASDWPEIAQDEIDPFIEKDDNGRATGWKNGTPPSLIEKSNAYIRARAKWDEVVSDPRRLSEAIEQQFQTMLDSHLDGRLEQREQVTTEQRAEQEFLTSNSDWLYEKDPYSGQPSNQPTAAGRHFHSIFESTKEQYGVTNMAKRIQLATQLFQAQQAAAGITPNQPAAAPVPARPATVPAGQQQPAATQTTAADVRRQMLGQRNGAPARPTSAAGVNDGPGGSPAGASRMSYGQLVASGMKQEGTL